MVLIEIINNSLTSVLRIAITAISFLGQHPDIKIICRNGRFSVATVPAFPGAKKFVSQDYV